MLFKTNNGAEVIIPRTRSSFVLAIESDRTVLNREVRNWNIFLSNHSIAVFNAYGVLYTCFNKEDGRVTISEKIDTCPKSVSQLLVRYVENLWQMALEEPVPERDNAGLSDRTFGIELEFCFPSQWTRETLCAHMRDMGLAITCCGYTHEVRRDWKMTTDSSVRTELPNYNTCEISSPILRGREGLLEVNKLCQILDDCGCVVNRTCGFHVHHGARDLSVTQRLGVIDFYRKNEDIIDTLVSRSRRGNNNSYSGTLRNYSSTAFANTRYLKVNACAYSKYGTLEFRQHQGTINYQKIANWIKLTQRIMEVSRSKIKTYSSLEQMLHALDLDICLDFFQTRARELA